MAESPKAREMHRFVSRVGAPLTLVMFVLVKQLYVREALGTETPLPTDPSY